MQHETRSQFHESEVFGSQTMSSTSAALAALGQTPSATMPATTTVSSGQLASLMADPSAKPQYNALGASWRRVFLSS